MEQYNLSLLFPHEDEYSTRQLDENVINDLSIDFICNELSNNDKEQRWIKDIFINICDDEEVIKYRSDIFEDLLMSTNLRKRLEEQLRELSFLSDIRSTPMEGEESSIWQLILRLRELDSYGKSIINIRDILKEENLKSSGLLRLRKVVEEVAESNGFKYLIEDVKELNNKVGNIKSITLGINLDEDLNPSEVTIVSLNENKFSNSSFLKKFISFTQVMANNAGNSTVSVEDAFNGVSGINKSEKNFLKNNLTKDIEKIMKTLVNDLKKVLRKYISTNVKFLVDLIPEITYYIRCANMVEKIRSIGMPMCRSKVLSKYSNIIDIKEVYNIKLAFYLYKNRKNVDEIVTNDIKFNDDARIFILTGPNRGGKTTFTQAIGLVQVFFQGGIYVPGSNAEISPVDSIYTHFPIDENKTVELGRLGEEVKRLNSIFENATDKSLILLNESLATTSHIEGLYIAKDVVKGFRYLGARVLFNTHMHDLAEAVDEINRDIEGKSNVASLVTGIDKGKRSYKVYFAPPLGISYAKDIAEKYGVTFEMIKENIERQNIKIKE